MLITMLTNTLKFAGPVGRGPGRELGATMAVSAPGPGTVIYRTQTFLGDKFTDSVEEDIIAALAKLARPGAHVILAAVHVQGQSHQHPVRSPFVEQALNPGPVRDAVPGGNERQGLAGSQQLLADRHAEAVTDAMRCLALECVGYEARMVEWAPLDHTAKNTMLVATRSSAASDPAARLRALAEFHGVRKQRLCGLLDLELPGADAAAAPARGRMPRE